MFGKKARWRESDLQAEHTLHEVPGNLFPFLRMCLDSNCWRWYLRSSLWDSSFFNHLIGWVHIMQLWPQSVLKIDFGLTKRWDRERWVSVTLHGMAHASCLGCRKALVVQTSVETTPLLCRSSFSATVDSFQSGGTFASPRALTIVNLLMGGCSQGHEHKKNWC